ncbi:MAG: serine/threonine protein kinase [Deltaproteobacteria bacterium]|nr:serine/threonine protein kinase [Deltaproteobacteria bacterium]
MNGSQEESPSPLEVAQSRVGQALNSKWRLDRLLGLGGMAAVYAATHRNGSRAAVKVLDPGVARDEGVRNRFLREARIANTVDHPARVTVVDDDVSDRGEPFLVMELLEGAPLDRHIRESGGKLSLEEVLRIFDPVLDLLAACHARQIIHRDIKPANIYLCSSGQIRVLDFGVARMRDQQRPADATIAGTALGSPAYTAPEQAMGMTDQLDGRADLFSVGACMYTALSGQRLNQAPTVAEQFIFAATIPAPSIAHVAPDLPVEAVSFIDRALAYERAHRCQDAQTRRRELGALWAAARAGQLTAPEAPRTGAVMRGNEAIETGGKLAGRDRQEIVARLSSVWRLLSVAMFNARQYGWTHPQTGRSLELAFDEIVNALASRPDALCWDVTPYAFTFQDEPVWEPERVPLDRVPYDLFANGLRKIQLKPGITAAELKDFVGILMLDSGAGGAAEDSVTAFWDRHFEHVLYLAVDSFAEGDVDERERFESQCDEIAAVARSTCRLDQDAGGDSLEAHALYHNLAVALREAGRAASELSVDAPTRTVLGAQIAVGPEIWTERFHVAFAHALGEAAGDHERRMLTAPLESWAVEQARLRNHNAGFDLFARLVAALPRSADQEDLRARQLALGRAIFTPAALGWLITGLAEEDAAGEAAGSSAAADPTLVANLERALAFVPDDSLVTPILEHLDKFRARPMRETLGRYLSRWAAGHEPQLADALPDSTLDTQLLLIGILRGLDSPGVFAAAESALKSKHARVRAEAIAVLARGPAERLAGVMQRLLGDADSANRCEALHLAAQTGLATLAPALEQRIEKASFHELGMFERRDWLATLVLLSPQRGETILIELLGRWRVVPEPAFETTRVAAARVLGEAGSSAALKPLQRAGRKIWWNSPAVRDAARQAADALTARLGTAPEAGKEDG